MEVTQRADGVGMALRVAEGPYFLSELLAVQVALHNHRESSIGYLGFLIPAPGRSPFLLILTGGEPPQYDLAWSPPGHGPRPPRMPLAPGQTIALDFLLPLTASGLVTLTAHARLYASVTDHDGYRTTTQLEPFAAGGPSLVLPVAPVVPGERRLQLQRRGTRVDVTAPPEAVPHLVYQFLLTCSTQATPGTLRTGTRTWQPLPSEDLEEPACPEDAHRHGAWRDQRWQVMVSAPGYPIVSLEEMSVDDAGRHLAQS